MDKEDLLELLNKQGFSEKIVEAFSQVKRENHIPDRHYAYAYEDIPLPLENGSTISQPSTIAFMLNLLDPKQNQKILEIGSGSGYVLSLISRIIKIGKIFGIERLKTQAVKSKLLLSRDSNIEILNRDGSNGLPSLGPFDRILISAAFSKIPYYLLNQLKEPGILVTAVNQSIFQLKKEKGQLLEKEYPGFSFVPMIEENK